MASISATVNVRVQWKNKNALRAVGRAIQLLESLEEDFPYRPEVRYARKALRYAIRNIEVRSE